MPQMSVAPEEGSVVLLTHRGMPLPACYENVRSEPGSPGDRVGEQRHCGGMVMSESGW